VGGKYIMVGFNNGGLGIHHGGKNINGGWEVQYRTYTIGCREHKWDSTSNYMDTRPHYLVNGIHHLHIIYGVHFWVG
jgi:hypothetical protein